MSEQNHLLPEITPAAKGAPAHSRRHFLGLAGALAGAGIIGLSSCSKDDNNPVTPVNTGIDLGSGDVGILNYAYALEQLESAFYKEVVAKSASVLQANELAFMKDIAAHELAHAKFFKAAIAAAGATPLQDLTPDFSSITFTDRTAVLNVAKTFEDLGIAAYNGAGKLLKTAAYLTIAGKIVSVEARHAALIRDLISPGSFADLASADLMGLGSDNANGLDGALSPDQVLSAAGKYIKERLNASNLPKS